MYDAGHWRSDRHGEREESQQWADGLAGAAGAAEVEGNGADEGDEAAIEESEEAAETEEELVLLVASLGGQGQQHRADTKDEEGQLPGNRNISLAFYDNL